MLVAVNLDPEADRALALALEDVKSHVRVDGSAEDDRLTSYVRSVVAWYEAAANRALIQGEFTAVYDGFPGSKASPREGPVWCGRVDRYAIFLPRNPVTAVASIVYVDAAGVSQTLSADDYRVTLDTEPATIVPAIGKSWPSTAAVPGAVRVTFTAGHGAAAADVPEQYRQVLRLLVAHFYGVGREPVVTGTIVNELPFALRSSLWSTRVFLGAA